jgi:hypothetical protein
MAGSCCAKAAEAKAMMNTTVASSGFKNVVSSLVCAPGSAITAGDQ